MQTKKTKHVKLGVGQKKMNVKQTALVRDVLSNPGVKLIEIEIDRSDEIDQPEVESIDRDLKDWTKEDQVNFKNSLKIDQIKLLNNLFEIGKKETKILETDIFENLNNLVCNLVRSHRYHESEVILQALLKLSAMKTTGIKEI